MLEEQTGHDQRYSPSFLFTAFILAILALVFLIIVVVGIVQAWTTIKNISPYVVIPLVIVACLMVLAVLAGMAYRQWQLAQLDIQAKADELRRANETHQATTLQLSRLQLGTDERGNRTAILLPDNTLIVPPTGNYLAPVQSVPHSIHYAPHFSYRDTSTQVTEEDNKDVTQVIEHGYELPPVEQFYEQIAYNSLQTGLGVDLKSGKLLTAEILSSTHFKFIGGSDTGKSCLAAATLDIATATNDQDHLRIGLLDMEHKTSQLFEHLPHVAEIGPRRIRLVGRNPEEVAQRINLLKWEMNRRAKLSEHDLQLEPVLLVYVEEMLALKYEVEDEAVKKQMLADINILGVRARKYRIFLLAVMQIDYSDKSTREAMAMFRTRGGFALDPDAARASGFHSTDLVKANYKESRQGQYVLEKPAYKGLVLAPHYDVKARLAQIGVVGMAATNAATRSATNREGSHYQPLPDSDFEEENSGHYQPSERATTDALQAILQPFTEQEKRILEKYKSGMTVKQIIGSEYTDGNGKPLTAGNLYTQKSAEIQQLVIRCLQ